MTIPKLAGVNYISLSAGKFDTEDGSDAARLASIMSDIAAKKPKSLVIHFHGGLVGREPALASAAALTQDYKDAGAESFFVIWETSPLEIIGQNIKRITNDPLFEPILNRVSEFVKGKLDKTVGPAGGRGVSDLPRTLASEIDGELELGKRGETMFADLEVANLSSSQTPTPDEALSQTEQDYIENEINGDDDIKRHVAAILAGKAEPGGKGVEAGAPEASLLDPEVIAEMTPVDAEQRDEKSKSIFGAIMLGKRVVTVVGAVIWRLANGRDHGLYLTIVEETMRAFYVRAAGRFLWTEMKDAVGKGFAEDPDCGGTAMVAQLAGLWKNAKPCITLVGHSAGAIYAARLLKQLNAAMDGDFRLNMVLIAPACTFDYLADALDAAGDRISNLRIFGMSDAVERQDHLVPLIFPASLLYFVSGVLEDIRDEPLVGMQRYYSDKYGTGFNTVAQVRHFGGLQKDHRYAWSQVAGCEGANCDMVTHGGWAGAPATLESIQTLIRKGCPNVW